MKVITSIILIIITANVSASFDSTFFSRTLRIDYQHAGNAEEADSIYQLLIQYFPKRQQYIHGRAKSATGPGEYGVASHVKGQLQNICGIG